MPTHGTVRLGGETLEVSGVVVLWPELVRRTRPANRRGWPAGLAAADAGRSGA